MANLEIDFRQIVESQDDLVSLARYDGELIYVNPAYAAHYGRSPADLIGANLLDFVPEDQRSKVAQRLRDTCESNQVYISKNEITKPDGRQRWIEWSNMAIRTTLDQAPVIHSVGRDIDARVHTELLLQEFEERCRFLAEHTTDMILVLSTSGQRLYVSPSCERILGYTPAEYLVRSIYDDGHPEDIAKVMAALANDREVRDFTYRFRHKNGNNVWLESSGGVVDFAGQPTERVYVIRDITERKNAEFRMQSIRDGIDLGYLVAEFALDGKVLAVNDKFCQAFGYTRDEALTMTHADLQPYNDIEQQRNNDVLRAALRQGELRMDGSKRIGKDGKIIWLNASFFPINGQDGQPTHVMKVAKDVSASIEIRERLMDIDARMQAVFNAVSDGIIIIDADGTIESLNASAPMIFGYGAEEVIGKNVKMLMPLSDAEGHDNYLRGNFPVNGLQRLGNGRELTGQHKSGAQFPVEFFVNEMNLAGRRMFAGVVRDITERKQAETAKSQFIATISHELRTPLTSIKGSLGLLRGGAVGKLPPSANGMLDIASNNCDRLVRLINDILDADKMSIDKMDFRMETVDLCSLLRSSIEANTGYAKGRNNVQFTLKLDVERAQVRADPDRLMQVMANLLSNAIKYSRPEGVVEVALARAGRSFRVSVRDHGAGIDPSFWEKIFGKFEQADSSDSRKREGTGLGLNIAKTIVEKHGGVIGFESELGEGTKFYFDLWAISPVAAAPTPTKPSRGRILVCEDEPDIAHVLRLTLEGDAFEVEVASNADEAKAAIAGKAFDAMTLDIGLPGQSGLSFLSELRGSRTASRLPVVVVSGRARSAIALMSGESAEPNAWLRKPVEGRALLECVRAAVANTPTRAARILHVEDDPDIVDIVAAIVGDSASIVSARSLADAQRRLSREDFELTVLDLLLPDGAGEALLPIAKRNGDPMPVMVFSEIEVSQAVRENADVILPKYGTNGDTIRATLATLMARRGRKTSFGV